MKNYNQIQSDLNQFIGTLHYYEIFDDFLLTDGIKYFIELCPCCMQILLSTIKKTVDNNLQDEMQFIVARITRLGKSKEYNNLIIYSEPDKDEPHFWDMQTSVPKEISLPIGEYRIWYQNHIFLLPSEY